MATVAELQREVEIAREGLKNVDENIKKLTGRDPSEFRPMAARRVSLKRDFAERSAGGRGFGAGGKRQDTVGGQGRLWSRVVVTRKSQDEDRPSRQLDSDGEEEEDDSNKPAIQSSVVATATPLRLKREDVVKSDEKTKSRNRRMFGMLLGTLQKFKQDSACKTDKDVRREEINKKLEEAEIKEKEEILHQKRELFTSRRAKQAELKQLEWKIEITALQEEWDSNGKKLCNFIKTKSKPHIHYLPAKHTEKSTKLLEESSRAIKRAMAERRAVIEEELQAMKDIFKPSNEEGNDGEGKGNGETVEREKQLDNEIEEDVYMKEERKDNDDVSHSESGDTRRVIIVKEENGESMDVVEQD